MENFVKKDWKKSSVEERLAEVERLRKEFYKVEYEKIPEFRKYSL